MFDYVGDGGIGFQLSMYRLIDDLDQVGSIGRENALLTQNDTMRSNYNRLLTQAQAIERALQERNQQVVALQNELAARSQQLESTKQELQALHERNAFEASRRRMDMIAVQDRARARRRERDAGSQPT